MMIGGTHQALDPPNVGHHSDDAAMRRSNQLNDLSLRVLVGIDVPLGDAQARMPGQYLHISERAAHERDLSRCVGDEGTPPAVA